MAHVEGDDVSPDWGGKRMQVGKGPRSACGGGAGGEPLTTPCTSLPCRAIEKLSDQQLENCSFKISYIPDEEVSSPPPPQRSRRGGHSSRERGSSPGGSSQPKQLEFPLRMLVPTQFVGLCQVRLSVRSELEAVPPRAMSHELREEQRSRARSLPLRTGACWSPREGREVDIHRKENAGAAEKPITIHATPEGCSEACRMILDIMQKEADETKSAEEIPLKILAHNSLVGSLQDLTIYNPERTITVKGSTEACSNAEVEIMKKLREAYESDVVAVNQQANLIPGLNLSALGIFSTGLSMLPSTPGARGAAAATPYHPFAVSVACSWCLELLGLGATSWGVLTLSHFGEDAHCSSKVERTGNEGGSHREDQMHPWVVLLWVPPVFKDWLCPKGAAL
ncbi:hypothetical protein EK904_000392 [Melospiza melodia maxima]|nr:hypothetical protein EK904_000392 [Melospiza melodia maxima]